MHNISGENSGGPTQEELLEQLQKCDISSSRVSSAFSSRAPSPSPSLMSIMYPGLKVGMSPAQAGTPTALLRSLGPPPNNVFQPIQRNSASGSNLSLSAIAASVLTTNTAPATLQASTPLALNIPEDRVMHSQFSASEPAVNDSQPLGPTSEATIGDTEDESSDKRSADSPPEDHPVSMKVSQLKDEQMEGERVTTSGAFALAHQRSRSNEIDYISGAPRNGVGQVSPPGSHRNLRAFRPVSAGSTSNTNSAFFSDSFSYVLPTSEDGSRKNLNESNRTLTPDLESALGKSSGFIVRVSSEGHPAPTMTVMSQDFPDSSSTSGEPEVTNSQP